MNAIPLFASAHAALYATSPEDKCQQVFSLWQAWQAQRTHWDKGTPIDPDCRVGRPERPLLVPPNEVEQRKPASLEGRAILLHAITHIEFNAINLALDAVYRFREMPLAYYGDWLKIAKEEAEHFTLLQRLLQQKGYDYGAFNAHNGLWEMAQKTRHDVMIRMALVPRILEARGLDVTPSIYNKLQQAKEHDACAILDVILREEIGHVAIGNRWYHYCCQARGAHPIETFVQLLRDYQAPAFRPPFNWQARSQAGFTADERALIESLAVTA